VYDSATEMLPVTFVAYRKIFLPIHLLFTRKSFTCMIPGHFCFRFSHPSTLHPHPKIWVLQGAQEKNETSVKGMPWLLVQQWTVDVLHHACYSV